MSDKTEQSAEKLNVMKPKKTRKRFRAACIFLMACFGGYIHFKYVSMLHENNFHYSHLSELEREMAFRTEQGFYYMYYKTVVKEKQFSAAVFTIMHDRLIEHPKEVNAFNRFNIYPEVILGVIYRSLAPYLQQKCHTVSRGFWKGAPLPDLISCEGLGEPTMLYLHAIWLLAGFMVAAVILHAATISEGIIGGVIAATQYFANHSESTRVMWTPNERENFAAPLLFLQMALVTKQLKQKSTSIEIQVSMFILNCLCLLFWQFSQFVFLTQIAILFVMKEFRIIDLKSLCVFLHSHFCGLHMAVLLLQGNDMLKSSFYSSFFIVITSYSLLFGNFKFSIRKTRDIFIEMAFIVFRIHVVVGCALYVKILLSQFLETKDDNHIWDLLMSKLTNHKTFHTLLYTASDVFDYLPLSTIVNLIKTLVLPMVVLSCIDILLQWTKDSKTKFCANVEKARENEVSANKSEIDTDDLEKDNEDDADDSGIENNIDEKERNDKNLDVIENKLEEETVSAKEMVDNEMVYALKLIKVDAAMFYNMAQLVVFGSMAVLFMRLKLLFVTHLCVMSSLIVKTRFFKLKPHVSIPLYIVGAAIIINQLLRNVSEELSIIGEFSDPLKEELLLWISEQTPLRAAFAGSMPLMASVVLCTRRPVVLHPHYENAQARDRVYAVYKMYGRFSPHELYQGLSELQATYLIVEYAYCYGYSNKGYQLHETWDIEAPHLANMPKLCELLLKEHVVEHFYRVFSNDNYVVFRIHDMSVRYMPRSFDT